MKITTDMRLDLNDFVKWQQEAPEDRKVRIEIGTLDSYEDDIKVWVYNWKLQTGQYVNSVDEIALEEKKVEEERAELKRLLALHGE